MTGLFAVSEATWPAAALHQAGAFTVPRRPGRRPARLRRHRRGRLDRRPISTRLRRSTAALGQPPLFMIRDGEEALDAALAARGYAIMDPVTLYVAAVATLAVRALPPMSGLRDLAAPGDHARHLGRGRHRPGPDRGDGAGGQVRRPRSSAASNDRAAGAAFVAGIHDGTAMLHALHIVRRPAPARLCRQDDAPPPRIGRKVKAPLVFRWS